MLSSPQVGLQNLIDNGARYDRSDFTVVIQPFLSDTIFPTLPPVSEILHLSMHNAFYHGGTTCQYSTLWLGEGGGGWWWYFACLRFFSLQIRVRLHLHLTELDHTIDYVTRIGNNIATHAAHPGCVAFLLYWHEVKKLGVVLLINASLE
jgi:hypothetical protein